MNEREMVASISVSNLECDPERFRAVAGDGFQLRRQWGGVEVVGKLGISILVLDDSSTAKRMARGIVFECWTPGL